MQFKSIPWWLWLVPIVLLSLATARMPYGYYTFIRVVVCGFAGFLAYVSWEGDRPVTQFWSVIFGLVAILFNPIIPIYLSRATWAYFDIGTAMLIAAHLVFVRIGVGQVKRQQ
jgi:hypothetical protein